MGSTIRTILEQHFDSYAQTHRQPAHVHQATRLLRACRSGRLGRHVEACPEGHVERVVPHSCRHRLCPQCHAVPQAQWLEKMQRHLLACAHHHLIFTLPHELHGLWRYNRAWRTQTLFATVAATLHTLCADPTHLGAQPGFLLALHTWGRALPLHPHIHALLTDGGLSAQGAWQRPKRSCVLPARVVMHLFRGKLLGAITAALTAGRLQLPADEPAQRLLNLCHRLGRKKWNVYVCRRYEHGQGVLSYLARYLRGGPVHDRQVRLRSEQQIQLRYRPHDDPEHRAHTLLLSAADFLGRYLQHAPLPYQPLVRHYGLYATRAGAEREQAREIVQYGPHRSAPTPRLTAKAYYLRRAQGPSPATHCAVCGQPLVITRRLPPMHDPPH